VVIQLKSGATLEDELAVANAHPSGHRPFSRPDYVRKFDTLTAGLLAASERDRFLALCDRLAELSPAEVSQLNVQLSEDAIQGTERDSKGIF